MSWLRDRELRESCLINTFPALGEFVADKLAELARKITRSVQTLWSGSPQHDKPLGEDMWDESCLV